MSIEENITIQNSQRRILRDKFCNLEFFTYTGNWQAVDEFPQIGPMFDTQGPGIEDSSQTLTVR